MRRLYIALREGGSRAVQWTTVKCQWSSMPAVHTVRQSSRARGHQRAAGQTASSARVQSALNSCTKQRDCIYPPSYGLFLMTSYLNYISHNLPLLKSLQVRGGSVH